MLWVCVHVCAYKRVCLCACAQVQNMLVGAVLLSLHSYNGKCITFLPVLKPLGLVSLQAALEHKPL